MGKNFKEFLNQEVSLIRQDQQIYINFAKQFNLTTVELFTLEKLFGANEPVPQQVICRHLILPKQTVNSVVKKLIEYGYVDQNKNSEKQKRGIFLTERGKSFCNVCIMRLLELEELTIKNLTEEEQNLYLTIFSKLITNKQEVFSVESKEKEE